MARTVPHGTCMQIWCAFLRACSCLCPASSFSHFQSHALCSGASLDYPAECYFFFSTLKAPPFVLLLILAARAKTIFGYWVLATSYSTVMNILCHVLLHVTPTTASEGGPHLIDGKLSFRDLFRSSRALGLSWVKFHEPQFHHRKSMFLFYSEVVDFIYI